jgi:putative membrane-bound dehydrogenase-like protein
VGWALILGVLYFVGGSARGDRPAAGKSPPASPLSPEQAQPLFHVPDGLKVELVASEPDVQSPVAMAFDKAGRLWVVEMLDYPNGPPPGRPPAGRIRLLQDRGDGRYTATGVFADGLLFANGVLPWKGGLVVTEAPFILYLQDTKGTGKADQVRKLYEGFTARNPQLRVSHPNLGLDNWIYVANGLLGGKVRPAGHKDAPAIDISGRDFRFDLVGHRAEAVTGMGQYGNTFDDWGRRFVCSNRNHWVHLVLPERYVRRNPYLAVPPPRDNDQGPGGAARVYPLSKQETTAPEHAGSFTAACGVFIYRGDLLPEGFRGCVFTCEPTGNLVHQEVLLPKGATFTGRPARQGVEFLATTDNWFRPVFLTSGPDGALYVVDMYRKVIEHPEWMPKNLRNRTDLELGKDRGRIWRIVPDGGKRRERKPGLDKASTADLVKRLGHADAWQRTTAQRLLLERQDPAAEAPLRELVNSPSHPLAQVHAAWLLEQRGKLGPIAVLNLLGHESPRVREHGVRLAEPFLAGSEPVRRRVLELAGDGDARLRFQVALSLGEWDDDRILPALARIAVANADDPWSRLAVGSSVPRRAEALIALLLRPGQQLLPKTTPDMLRLVEEVATLVGGRRDPGEVADTLEAALRLSGKDAGGWQMAVRKGLAEGMQRRGVQLAAFLRELPAGRRELAARMEEMTAQTVTLARDGTGGGPERALAIRLLAQSDWLTAGPVLGKLVRQEPDATARLAAVRALASFPEAKVGQLLADAWQGAPPTVRRELLEALLARPERTLVLLKELEGGRINPADLDVVRRLQLVGHRRSDVRERARKLLERTATPERRTVVEEYRPALKLVGDVRRGRVVFQKATCAGCHRLGGVGVTVGPDISDVRSRSPEALLVDILDPNAAIDGNYVNYLVTLKDGKVLTGLLAAETASAVTLRRAEGQSDTVLRQDIEPDGILATGKSLMPEGLEKGLTVQDMADLLAFLRGWTALEAGPRSPKRQIPSG